MLSRTMGCCSTLPGHARAIVPAFDADIAADGAGHERADVAVRICASAAPSSRTSERCPPYGALAAACRKEMRACSSSVGPIAGGLWRALRERPAADRPALWVLSELDEDARSDGAPWRAARCDLGGAGAQPRRGARRARAASGSSSLHFLALGGRPMPRMVHAHARGYPSGRYGSQSWHRRECGLDVPAILGQLAGEGCLMSTTRVAGAGAARPGPGVGRERLHRRQSHAHALGSPLGCVRHGLARAGLATLGLERRTDHHGRSARARQSHGASRPRAAGDGVRLRGLRRLFVRAGHRADVSDQRAVQAGADRES